MPVPSGKRSSCRSGGGFQISNARKSIKPSKTDFHENEAPVRAINCPATSSMTTNCGSLIPVLRATCVAAGMPVITTTAAALMVAGNSHFPGISRAANAHTMTVASDPQVPGPGLIWPTPNTVAIATAQAGAECVPELLSLAVGSMHTDKQHGQYSEAHQEAWRLLNRLSFGVVWRFARHEFIGRIICVLYRRGDHITAARPFS